MDLMPFFSNNHQSIYHGLPILFGNSKKSTFIGIIDKVKSKVDDWRAKTLSQAGRLVLIKSIAAAIPSYVMSTFLLPKSICSQLDRFSKTSGGVSPPQKPETFPSSHGTPFALPKFLVALVSGV